MDIPNPGIKPGSPALQADSLPAELPGSLQDFIFQEASMDVSVFFHLRQNLNMAQPLQSFLSPDSSVGKESTCSAGDLGSIPELGRSPGEGKGYPL